ncbi:putative oxidoreductase [Hyphodiscus hymeniophilus]|uniref:Oxidoreductase n=1 Tax=Hyphodiscus hymeniophilus TaxID=353542 RepID=A0A9P7AXJ6_9HELO|nr:putative oxidoreductase [Hyphodiscus hymeniophilus]
MSNFTPASLPDLTGFRILITGGHSGLLISPCLFSLFLSIGIVTIENFAKIFRGLTTTTELARHRAKVYIASRSRSKAEQTIQKIITTQPNAEIEFIEMDLADLRSVKKGAEEYLTKETKLHILINNAGVMCTPFSLTAQRVEAQFQTNYLAHFYLTQLLLPTLQSTSRSLDTLLGTIRIVNVSSDGHAKLTPKEGIPFSDMTMEHVSTWTRYGVSKLAQVLHAKEVARRYGPNGIIALSLHPGTVKTNLSAGPRGSTWWYKVVQPLVELGAPGPEKGCWNTLWCAAGSDVKKSENGSYFEPVGKRGKASVHAEDVQMAEQLWGWSEGVLRDNGL